MTDKRKTPNARLQCFELIFENNSTMFHAYSLQHVVLRIVNMRIFDDEDGALLEIILPSKLRLNFDYHIFINEFYRKKNISEIDLIHKQQTHAPRKTLSTHEVPFDIQTKSIHIRNSEGYDQRLPIIFTHWFGKHYAMFIGDTNTRWFYDTQSNELD
jgi:hypothetical protein